MDALQRLHEAIAGLGRVLLGYSGGVDSSLLAVVGRRALDAEGFLAVIGRSPSYPAAQHAAALRLAAQFEIPVLELATGELEDSNYLSNPLDRCYFCKSDLWGRLTVLARARGFTTVIDGTNADDLGEHRPGARAGVEHGVRSPLAELGWSKASVREAARTLNIPGWDAPAAPCLSSRIRYGLRITPDRLRQVEDGEAFLRSVGIRGDLRVHHHEAFARIEVSPDEMGLVTGRWPEIEQRFRVLGFGRVELDPRGYRRGGLLRALPVLDL